MNSIQWKMVTKVGTFYLVVSPDGLQGLHWHKQEVPMVKSLDAKTKEMKMLLAAIKQVEEYIAGTRTKFNLPLDVKGTDFQKRVWNELKKIPYGETRSYKDIAIALKDKNAVRAVGTANGRNPISIIVPCHRVIGSNGALTGYAGGLEVKIKLLDLEKKLSAKP